MMAMVGTLVIFLVITFVHFHQVTSYGSSSGPQGVTVALYTERDNEIPVGTTTTANGGTFYFTPIQPGKYVLVASHSQ